MKKIFGYVAIATVAFAFAACGQNGGNTPSEPSGYTIEISDITAKGAHVAVTPADSTKTYYWDVLEAAEAAKMTDEEIGVYFKEYFDYVIEYYAGYKDLTYEDLLLNGFDEYDYTSLDQNTEYVVVAIAMDANAVASGKAERKSFQTLEIHEDPVPSDMTFEIAATGVTYNSATVTVTPSSNDHTYYWNIFNAADIAGMSDDELCATMKDNIEYIIEYYEYYGVDISFEDMLSKGPDSYEFTSLSANSDYTVVAVAMGNLGTTNGAVAKYNFQTPQIEATDSLTLDIASAQYSFYEEYSVLQVIGEDSVQGLELGLTFETTNPTGTYTIDDCYEDGYYYWNYIYDIETEEIYEFIDLNVTGTLEGEFYIYSGYGIAENGVKYIFSDVKATEYVAPETAPAKKAAKKVNATRNSKLMKKLDLNKKSFKIATEKALSR